MTKGSPISTPKTTSWKLNKDDEPPSVDSTLYRSMIGKLSQQLKMERL